MVNSTQPLESSQNRGINSKKRVRTTYVVSYPLASTSPFDNKVNIYTTIKGIDIRYNVVSNEVEEFLLQLLAGTIPTKIKPNTRNPLAITLEKGEKGEEFPVAENFFDALDNLFGNYLTEVPYLGKLFITDIEEKYQNRELKCVQVSGNNTTKNLQGVEKITEFTATLWLQGQLNGWYYFNKPFNSMASEKLHRAVENYFKFN